MYQVGNEIDEFVTEALRNNLVGLPLDLAALNIRQEVFSSEKALHQSGEVKETIAELRARDLVYQGTLPPPKGGTRMRFVDIPPDTAEYLAHGAARMQDAFAQIGDDAALSADGRSMLPSWLEFRVRYQYDVLKTGTADIYERASQSMRVELDRSLIVQS